MGDSVIIKKLKEQICIAAHLPWTVLLLGETGSGKEIVARAIHNEGTRKDKPFISVNCGGMPDTLVESELFGYVKGAFTDAKKDKKGTFEEADGGTIFLDEIGNSSYKLQTSLLRILETGKIAPIGANSKKPVDVRIICATNKTSEELKHLQQGIRGDLLNRIGALIIIVPPLRDHKEDIPSLVSNFLSEFSGQIKRFSPEKNLEMSVSYNAMNRLIQWDFKEGNIRELRNILQRAIMFSGKMKGEITEWDIERAIFIGHPEKTVVVSDTQIKYLLENNDLEYAKITKGMKDAQKMKLMAMDEEILKEKERICFKRLLEDNGTITNLAKKLNISRNALTDKLRELGISKYTKQ